MDASPFSGDSLGATKTPPASPISHPRVDIERWIAEFPIALTEHCPVGLMNSKKALMQTVDRWRARGEIISSPEQLALVEQVRRRTAARHSLGNEVPVDLALFAEGPPPAPFLTKVGGLPWRSRSRPWPVNDYGAPMTFFAQFCFIDSQDVLPFEVPGDVMLVFFQHRTAYEEVGRPASLHIEWSPVNLEDPVRAADCPWPTFQVPTLHAHLYRGMEYPRSLRLFQSEGYLDYWLFAKTQATRIGMLSNFIVEDPQRSRRIPRDAEMICTLNSFMPATFPKLSPYPLISETPYTGRALSEIEALSFVFGDSGCIYFYIDEQAEVYWYYDSY